MDCTLALPSTDCRDFNRFLCRQYLTVTYGTSPSYSQYTCTVLQNNDTFIICSTQAGTGSNLRFRVVVGTGLSAQTAVGTDRFNYPPGPFIAYVRGCAQHS